MSDEELGCGCTAIVGIAILIGIGIRANNLTEFAIMALIAAGGVFMGLWALASFAADDAGCFAYLWGLFVGFCSLVLIVMVSYFLYTGDYDHSINKGKELWNRVFTTEDADQDSTSNEPTPTANPTETAVAEARATTSARATAVAVVSATEDGNGAGENLTPVDLDLDSPEWEWLLQSRVISPGDMTEALNDIWATGGHSTANTGDDDDSESDEPLDPSLVEQLTKETVEPLSIIVEGVTGTRQQAAALLLGAAYEQLRNTDMATETYDLLVDSDEDPEEITPYEISANLRAHIIAQDEKALDGFYTEAAAFAGSAWFLQGNTWDYDTLQQTAWTGLMDLRADNLLVMAFEKVREYSTFSDKHAYLFILVLITLMAKFLALPLYSHTARVLVKMRQLAPQVARIEYRHEHLPSLQTKTQAEETLALYEQHGINIWIVYMMLIVDLIFVIAVLSAMNIYQPQIRLDQGEFFWVADVTRIDWRLLAAWIGVNIVTSAITFIGHLSSSSGCQSFLTAVVSNVVVFSIIAVLAFFNDWPSYLFIFWAMLSIIGAVLNVLLFVIWNIIESVR